MSSDRTPTFQDHFDQFLDFSEQVLRHNLTGELVLQVTGGNKTNAIQTRLQGYRKVYSHTRESEKHVEKFAEVFKKCRSNLMKDQDIDKFMGWFCDTSFIISPKEKSRNQIQLTTIFRKCIKIADHIDDMAEKNPSKADEYYNDPAAVYPEQFMLHLFRLFTFCSNDEEKEMLNDKILELEEMLGLSEGEVPNSGDGFVDFISTASGMAGELGIDLPPGIGDVNGSDFKMAFNEFSKNDEAKSSFKDMFSGIDFNNPESMTGAFSNIMEKMSQNAKKVPEPVARSMKAESKDVPKALPSNS